MFSPLVVPKGSLQLENGTVYQHFQHGINYFDISETQVRLGLTNRSEFQMFVPNFVLTHQGHTDTTPAGVSDLGEVGIKRQITLKKLQISLIPCLNIPTGSLTVSGRGVQPVFRAPWSYPITDSFSIMGMQSLLLPNSAHTVLYEPDFMLSKSLTPALSVFAEYAGFFASSIPHQQIAHFGGTWKLNRHHQLDMHFGFGLDKAAPAAFIGAGYSYRFDRLPW